MENVLLAFALGLLVATGAGLNLVLRVVRTMPAHYTPGLYTAPAPAPRPRGGGGGFLASLLLLIFLSGLCYYMAVAGYEPVADTEAPAERVEERVVEAPERAGSAEAPVENFAWSVQVGAFDDYANAEEKAAEYTGYEAPVFIDLHAENGLYPVIVGWFANEAEAAEFRREHRLEGFPVRLRL